VLTIFLLVKTRNFSGHPAEHGIVFDVVVAPPALRFGAASRIHTNAKKAVVLFRHDFTPKKGASE
jgi:hypothetical protein